MRGLPADLIGIKAGINIVNGDTMRERTFVPASLNMVACGPEASAPSSSPLYQAKTSVRLVGTFANDLASARSIVAPLPLS